MKRLGLTVCVALVLFAVVGCQTTSRVVHNVPTTRDYKQLEKLDVDDAQPLVCEAHRVGAQHYAPYEFFSAKHYLMQAKAEKAENGRLGLKDYSALARDMAQAAIAKGGIPDGGVPAMPADKAAAKAEFDRLRGRYQELDKAKAIEVSPVLYAHIEAALSHAEHEILEARHWPQGARAMKCVGADIDTIWSQDVDGDGIIDMKDGAPWAPEDKDGFEDEDGIPDPDNDQDGVLDLDDVMPNDPETKNRWHDYDGAPDDYPTLEMLHFASGSATLSTDARGYLRGITELVKEWPELKLHVAGHTDEVHTEDYNIDLSRRRARNTQTYLVENGCPGGQLVVTFHGETQPCAEGTSAKARAMNRRVVLSFE